MCYYYVMTVKQRVLEKLDVGRGAYFSGEELGKELGVSRQAVGKAVASIKSDGYTVYAVKNRGYMMPKECDILSAQRISELTGARVLAFDSVGSTNAEAAKEYLSGGSCIVVSRSQTDGRRKDGGSFPSPCDMGIYFSIAAPLDIPLDKLGKLRKICGRTVADIVGEASGKQTACERLDEVYIGGNKVAGVLIECAAVAATGRTESVIIGIGIYTHIDGSTPLPIFPDDTRNRLISEIYLRITGQLKKL